jgi:hypothetical protein
LYKPVEGVFVPAVVGLVPSVPPTAKPATAGEPIAENKVVVATEGVPIDLNKPVAAIAALLLAVYGETAGVPGSPILAYNPVASEPTPETKALPSAAEYFVATAGKPIAECKPDAATGPLCVLSEFPVAALYGAPINPCKPVAGVPVLGV